MIVWQKLTDKMTDSSPLMAKRESYHYPTFIVLTKKLLPVGRKLPFPLPQSSFRPVSDLKRKLRFYKWRLWLYKRNLRFYKRKFRL